MVLKKEYFNDELVKLATKKGILKQVATVSIKNLLPHLTEEDVKKLNYDSKVESRVTVGKAC